MTARNTSIASNLAETRERIALGGKCWTRSRRRHVCKLSPRNLLPKRFVLSMTPGRNGAWVKMRVGDGQEFVIGGYTPQLFPRQAASPKNFDAMLVGYFERNKLMFAARVRNGFVPALRASVFRKFKGLESRKCPFANLPESSKGRWGEGLTAADMENVSGSSQNWSQQSNMRNGRRLITSVIPDLSRYGTTRYAGKVTRERSA